MGKPITVRNVMRTPIVTVDESASVKEAARLMVERGIGSVVVNREGKPYGIVTERDLIQKIVAAGVDASKVTVGSIMSFPLFTVEADAPLSDAMRRLVEKRIRRVCVADKGEIVGIVSQTDIVRALGELRELAKLGIV